MTDPLSPQLRLMQALRLLRIDDNRRTFRPLPDADAEFNAPAVRAAIGELLAKGYEYR